MRVVLACLLALCPALATAQDRYTLEIVQPTASLPSGHRMAHCYPGIVCEFPVIAVGGEYPYTFSLSNAPSGMTIKNAGDGETCGITTATHTHVACGRITWASPASSASNIQVTVADADNDSVNVTWSITVGTSGWRFIDDVGGTDSGSGGIGAPWRTVDYAKANSGAGDRWYFRTGTYSVQTEFGSLINPGGSRYQAEFSDNLVWLEYPGDTAVIDQGADDTAGTYFAAPMLAGSNAFIDGFDVTNCKYFCFLNATTSGSLGPIFYRNTFDHQGYGATDGGSNASMLMFEHTAPSQSIGAAILDNTFTDGELAIKHYDVLKAVTQDNYFTTRAAIEHKDGVTQFHDRGNRMIGLGGTAAYETGINGNQNGGNDYLTYGEVAFNLIVMTDDYGSSGSDEALMFGWMTVTGTYDAWRNTLYGKVTVYDTGATEGPFYFSLNVIINSGSDTGKVTLDTVSDSSRIVIADHVTGTRGGGQVETTYYTMTGATRTTYCATTCTRGHELNGTSGGGSSSGPVRLRIRGEN